MIDFHTHLLPLIDDGSRNIRESVKMLHSCALQGVTAVVATPHYYAEKEAPYDFLQRREKSWKALKEVLSIEHNYPSIYLGAEVKVFPGISDIEELQKLDIAGTGYILLEMPFSEWSDRVFRELDKIALRGMRPVIAHIERYLKIQKKTDNIERLLHKDFLIQSNAEFFCGGFLDKRRAVRMLTEGKIHLLGSDCHNLSSRPPNMKSAAEIIRYRLGEDTLKNLISCSERVLSNAVTEHVIAGTINRIK